MNDRLAESLVVLLLVLPACGDPSARTNGSAAPSVANEQARLQLSIEIDGGQTILVDAARLDAVSPDAKDGEIRIWRLKSLAGEDVYPGRTTAIEIQQQGGERRPLVDDEDAEAAREPMLAVNGQGAVRLALIRADERFPPFSDDRALAQVQRIWVNTQAATPELRKPSEAAAVRLTVMVGEHVSTWARPDFAKVEPLGYKTKEDEARDAWSLRDLVTALVGAKARVVAVEGEGKRVEISRDRWLDISLTPALRITRRGLVKLQWLTPAGKRPASSAASDPIELRGVTALKIATD